LLVWLFVTSILPKDGLLLLFKNERGGFPQGPFFNDLLGQPLNDLNCLIELFNGNTIKFFQFIAVIIFNVLRIAIGAYVNLALSNCF